MEQDPFDVVLLDHAHARPERPVGVAHHQTEMARSSEVVIITGYPTMDSAKEAVRLGAYDYVAKPVGPQDVIGVADSRHHTKTVGPARVCRGRRTAGSTRAA